MGKTAIEIFEEEAEWAEDRVLYGTVDHFSDRMDSFPVTGFGLGLVKRSAEGRMVERVEEELVPRVEEHLEVQLEVVEALAGGGEDAVRDEYTERLLRTNPLWDAIENEEARDDLVERDIEACRRAARWVEEAGKSEFEDFEDMTQSLGMSAEEAVEEIEPLLEYLPRLLERYREDIDLSGYSSLLESNRVREWFLDTLIEGLELSQEEALDELEERLRDSTRGT